MRKIHGVIAVIICITMFLQMSIIAAENGGDGFADTEHSESSQSNTDISVLRENDTVLNTPKAEKEEIYKDNIDVTYVHQNILELFGILGVIDSKDFDLKHNITRSEFAVIIKKFLPVGTNANTYKGYFEDVKKDSYGVQDIEELVDLGIISVNIDYHFYPNNIITGQEAIKMLCCVAGYGVMAEANNGYPVGYILTAQRIGLLGGLSKIDKPLDVDGMLLMLYNFLDVRKFDIVGAAGNDLIFSDKKSSLMLEAAFDAKHFNGIVTANDITALHSKTSVPKDCVEVQGVYNYIVECGDTYIADALGRSVDVYYTEDDDILTCIYYSDSKKTNITEIPPTSIKTINRMEIVYYDTNDKACTVKLNGDAAVLYNDIYYPGEVTEDILGEMIGFVSVIDNDNDDIGEVLVLKIYRSIVVGSVYENGFTDKNVKDCFIDIDRNNYDRIEMIYANGEQAILQDLNMDTIVSVAESDSSVNVHSIEIIVSDVRLSGVVSEISQGDNDYVILDDINKYNVLKSANITSLKVGIVTTACLDAFGNIASFNYANVGDFKYGVVISCGKAKGIASKVNVMIYLQNGSVETLEVTSKVSIDGEKYTKSDDILNALTSVNTISINGTNLPEGVYPVRVRINAEGQISEIDTPAPDADNNKNSLTYIHGDDNVLTSDYVLGGYVAIDAKTVVLNITSNDKTNIENYKETLNYNMTNYKDFGTGSTYSYVAYRITENAKSADFVMKFSGYTCGYDDMFTMIKSINQAYNVKTNMNTYVVKGMQGGNLVSVYVSDIFLKTFESLGLSAGEVIRYKTNYNGEMISIDQGQVIVDYQPGGVKLGNVRSGQTSLSNIRTYSYSAHLVHGYVKSKHGDLLEVAYLPIGSTLTSRYERSDFDLAEILLVRVPGNVPISVFNANEEGGLRFYSGMIDDIIDFEHDSVKYSRVLIRYRSAALKEIVVFNDSSLF